MSWWLRMFLAALFVAACLAPSAQAEEAERVVPLEGQVGPYWESRDLHVAGTTFTGAVPLRANESRAAVHLEVEDRAVGASAGYVVRFCRQPCSLGHDGPAIAKATGRGPFDLAFPLDDVTELHYRVAVKDGVRVDAHIMGTLILSGNGSEAPDLTTASTYAPQRIPGPSYAAIAAGVGLVGLSAAVPAIATRLRRFLPAIGLARLFTRRETLLDHPVRNRIYRTIRTHPGIHLRELRRALSLPPGQVDHHVQKLVHAGFVVTHAVRGYTAHFVPGTVDRKLMAALARVKSDAARTLLANLAEDGGLTLGRVAERTGIALSTASYHVGALQRLGLVEVRANGTQRLRVTALGRAFLDILEPRRRSGSRNGPESA